MDKGEFIKGGYMVRPGDGGSWIVYSEAEFGQGGERRYVTPTRGFTDYRDLMEWLEGEHEAVAFPLIAGKPIADHDAARRALDTGWMDTDIPDGTTLKEAITKSTTEAPK